LSWESICGSTEQSIMVCCGSYERSCIIEPDVTTESTPPTKLRHKKFRWVTPVVTAQRIEDCRLGRLEKGLYCLDDTRLTGCLSDW